MHISILGAHNRETPTSRCVSIVIDDTLALDAGGLTSSLSPLEQRKLKAIMLTHQHFDHIKDIPMIAINLFYYGNSIDLYSTEDVRDSIENHILNGQVYPKFQELPEGKPTVIFNLILPYEKQKLDGYEIMAVPVNHCKGTIGYQVSDNAGKSVFYTADTGPGLVDCWTYVSPQLLIVDVTQPNMYEEFAVKSGHLSPRLLKEELIKFKVTTGYLPRIVAIHMDPAREKEIAAEIAEIAELLNISIILAQEGMQLYI